MTGIGLIEMNEAFAVQVLANLVAFEKHPDLGPIDESILNVNGGAIALGHPVGSSGDPPHPDAAPRDAAPQGLPRARHALCRRRAGSLDPAGGCVMSTVLEEKLAAAPHAAGPSFRLAVEPDGLGIVFFDTPGEKVNKYSAHRPPGARRLPRRPREADRPEGAHPRLLEARHLHRRGRRGRDRECRAGTRRRGGPVRPARVREARESPVPDGRRDRRRVRRRRLRDDARDGLAARLRLEKDPDRPPRDPARHPAGLGRAARGFRGSSAWRRRST